jgi:hypothetical protein
VDWVGLVVETGVASSALRWSGSRQKKDHKNSRVSVGIENDSM